MIFRETRQRIEAALGMASDTKILRLGQGVVGDTGAVFRSCFPSRPAMVVADPNTFAAAGSQVLDSIRAARVETLEPVILDEPDLHAHIRHVNRLQQDIESTPAIPVAVGSGTINDLTKLTAHRCGRPYLVVATAASMDGYTAYGASVIDQGSKQTFFCPAPVAVIADLDIIARAPGELNAAGYADLIAKVTAGADWLLAAALECEPIDPQAWSLVQAHLRDWIGRPEAVRRGDLRAIAGLIEGLLMTGFAMQWCKSSRPASGAEHQFSHLWDMQHHRHQGRVPLHGNKVAIGTLASTLLYEELLRRPLDDLNVERVCSAWPDLAAVQQQVNQTHELPDLRTVAAQETQAKYITREDLIGRLERLKATWPDLKDRLQRQLIPAGELRQMLQEAGAPHDPSQIGIDRPRLRRSYLEARQIRRRFTVLDLAAQTDLMADCLKMLFAPDGAWTRRTTP